jgi:23S rRNA U2552 (ribose-2'-O)-methylase RlmE/FtsJ
MSKFDKLSNDTKDTKETSSAKTQSASPFDEFKKYNPLIFDLNHLKSSKIIDSNNDIKFSNNVSYPQLTLGFQHFIHKIKDKMELTEKYSNRKKIYLVTSLFEKTIDYKAETDDGIKYESIGEGVESFVKEINPKLPPLLNRAYLKLWEMLVYFDLIPDKEDFVSSHLCEGPGSFIQATVYFRELQEKLGKIKTSAKDNYYGVTLHSDTEHLQMQQDFIKYFDKDKTKRLHVLETKSVSEIKDMYGGGFNGLLSNGDITKINTIRLFGGSKDVESFAKPSDLVTADGGFDWKKENLQEQEAYKLIFSEIITAIKVQKSGGSFVLKIFESYTFTTLKFIEILRVFYKEVYICKPYTSRISNSEKYIICKDFDKSKATPNVIKKLEEIIITFNKNENFNIIDIFTDYQIPSTSIENYKQINIELMVRQYLGINNIVLFDNLDNKNGIEYNEFLDKQIDASVFWNELFLETKNYSKIFKFFKNFNFLESKSKFNSLDEFVDNFETEKEFKHQSDKSVPEPESESESEPEPEPESKSKSKSKQTRQTRQTTKNTSKKTSKKGTQKGGLVENEYNEQIIQLYNQDNDKTDNIKVGYLNDEYDDIINLNDI